MKNPNFNSPLIREQYRKWCVKNGLCQDDDAWGGVEFCEGMYILNGWK